MTATLIKVTAGDTQPLLTVPLYKDVAGTVPMPLTTATSVQWKMGTKTVTATIADATNGITTWQWDGTLAAGTYQVYAIITWNDTSKQTTVEPVGTLLVNAAP